jgi:hypothetical protein
VNDNILRIRFSKIFISPYFNIALLIKEDHFLINFKMTIFFVKFLKTLSRCIYNIQSLFKRYILDFIESYRHPLEKNRSGKKVITKTIFFCMMNIFGCSYETIAISPYDQLFVGAILILWVEDQIVFLELNAAIKFIRNDFEITTIKWVFKLGVGSNRNGFPLLLAKRAQR